MPHSGRPPFVFVDLENVPDAELRRLNGLPVKVTVLVGKKQPNVAKRLVEALAEVDFEVRLLRMGVVHTNALDFALAFHLGECTARHPHGRFYIVSKDKDDFDPLVSHLLAHHVAVSRHDSIAELPFLSQSGNAAVPAVAAVPKTKKAAAKPKAAQKVPVPSVPKVKAPATVVAPKVDRVEKALARLKDPATKNRPSSEKRLLAKLRNDLKNDPTLRAEDVVRRAQDEGILQVRSGGGIEYLNDSAREDG